MLRPPPELIRRRPSCCIQIVNERPSTLLDESSPRLSSGDHFSLLERFHGQDIHDQRSVYDRLENPGTDLVVFDVNRPDRATPFYPAGDAATLDALENRSTGRIG